MSQETSLPGRGEFLEGEEGGPSYVVLDSMEVMGRQFVLASPLAPFWGEFKVGEIHPVTPAEITTVQTLMDARDRTEGEGAERP